MANHEHSEIDRRTFLKGVGVGAASVAGATGLAMTEVMSSPGYGPPPTDGKGRTVYRGEYLRAVAMPLGGIGAGSIALAGDGGLRQWQVVNCVDHLAHVPHSFFALWAKPENGP